MVAYGHNLKEAAMGFFTKDIKNLNDLFVHTLATSITPSSRSLRIFPT